MKARALSLISILFCTGFSTVALSACVNLGKPKMQTPQERATMQVLELHLKLEGNTYGSDDERRGYKAVEEALDRALRDAGAGEFGRHEFGGGYCRIFLYGPSVDKMSNIVEPILRQQTLRPKCYMIKRYSQGFGPDAKIVRIELTK